MTGPTADGGIWLLHYNSFTQMAPDSHPLINKQIVYKHWGSKLISKDDLL